MITKFTRSLYLFCCVFFLTINTNTKVFAIDFPPTYSQNIVNVNLTSEWQEYSFTDGVLIEYRMEKMYSEDYGREVNMMVFRFTNTTDVVKNCSWKVKIIRDDVCYNCANLGKTEEIKRLKLDPNEIIEGNTTNLVTHSELNVFGNFVTLVPGMSQDKLTSFELINLTIK